MDDQDWGWLAIALGVCLLLSLLISGRGAKDARRNVEELIREQDALTVQVERYRAALDESRRQNTELLGMVQFCIKGEQ